MQTDKRSMTASDRWYAMDEDFKTDAGELYEICHNYGTFLLSWKGEGAGHKILIQKTKLVLSYWIDKTS